MLPFVDSVIFVNENENGQKRENNEFVKKTKTKKWWKLKLKNDEN